MSQNPVGAPSCYGTQWSATAVECTGGPDPAYTHPQTGAHVRERCGFYQMCGAATSSARLQYNQPQPALVPTAALTRPLPQPPAPVQVLPKPVAPNPYIAPKVPPQQFVQQYQQQYQPVQYQQQHMVPPWIAQQGPALVPMQYQQPGSQIPGYLSVPEPVVAGDSWLSRLFREIFRSVFKASAHTTASFFDHTPIKEHKPPQ